MSTALSTATTQSKQAHAPAVTQMREAAQSLLAEGRTEEAIDYLVAALAAVLQPNTDLQVTLAQLRRQQARIRSERVSPEQLALLLEQLQQLEPAASQPDTPAAEAEMRADAALAQQIEHSEKEVQAQKRRERPRTRGWRARDIDRIVHQVDVPEPERTCTTCGREKRKIGEDVTRTLEYVPAQFREHVYHLAKYACGTCKAGVSTAPAPPKVIERSDADASVLAQVVVSKFADHAPLHRQHRIYGRVGVNIPVSTLSDWVAGVADRLVPLVDVLAARVLGAYVVRTDATGIWNERTVTINLTVMVSI